VLDRSQLRWARAGVSPRIASPRRRVQADRPRCGWSDHRLHAAIADLPAETERHAATPAATTIAGGQGDDLLATLCRALTAAAAMSFRVTQSVVDASYFA
jgi:hypothetical protein